MGKDGEEAVGWEIYQIVFTLYEGIFESVVTIVKSFSIACAINNLSNGSLWISGKVFIVSASYSVGGRYINSSFPKTDFNLGISMSNCKLPFVCLIAISHNETKLKKHLFVSMIFLAVGESSSLPETYQIIA